MDHLEANMTAKSNREGKMYIVEHEHNHVLFVTPI